MQTPIDFGKTFLNRLFYEGNIDAAADAAAEDLLWTGDDRSLHIRTRQELEKMLELLAVRIREPHYVDIAAIKSQLCPDNTVLVTYELSLVPENVSRTLVLFCSMFIAPQMRHTGSLSFIFRKRPRMTATGSVRSASLPTRSPAAS